METTVRIVGVVLGAAESASRSPGGLAHRGTHNGGVLADSHPSPRVPAGTDIYGVVGLALSHAALA
jgi:hypothetical protein